MIKVVIFDFGGVLADEGYWQGLRYIAEQNGKDPDDFFNIAVELIHKPGGYVTGLSDERTYWNELRALTGIKLGDEELRSAIIDRFVLRPEMLQLADELKSKGFIVAILSDQTNWLDEIEAGSPFYHHFDFVFNSYDIHKSKRDRSVFTDICSNIGVEAAEAVFIDDSEGNVQRAQQAGLNTILFRDVISLRTELAAIPSPAQFQDRIYDCIIIGAGPGGLQAAIYLGRYNRDVLLIDRGGGRTTHAKHIENFLSQKEITGKEIVSLGIEQAKRFSCSVIHATVKSVVKSDNFEISAGNEVYRSRFVIVSSGARENVPEIENVYKFFGEGFFTCVDCDGYRTTGKKLVIIGNTIHAVRLAFAMKQMYTKDVALVLFFYDPPGAYVEELQSEGIKLIKGRPSRIIGDAQIEALEFQDGRRIACEVIMSNFGFKLNDDFLGGLALKKIGNDFNYETDHYYESSLKGLFIVGTLRGHDQVVVAAGQGATAAIEINKRLLDL